MCPAVLTIKVAAAIIIKDQNLAHLQIYGNTKVNLKYLLVRKSAITLTNAMVKQPPLECQLMSHVRRHLKIYKMKKLKKLLIGPSLVIIAINGVINGVIINGVNS